jgi:hypothetical protein
MIRQFFTFPIQFILLVLVQVLVLNNIQFSGFINPFLYILFVLWLPIETPKWLVLVLSMSIGLAVDIFSDTLGMHTSASIFLGYCRPYILKAIAPREGYEVNQKPSIQDLGFNWFLAYSTLCVLLHHLFLFFVEVFRFSEPFSTIGRSLASAFFTLILILITQFFFYNAEARK